MDPRQHTHRRQRLGWMLVAVLGVALVVAFRCLPQDQLAAFQAEIDRLGFLGLVLFAVLYIISSLLFAPGAVLTLMAGALFGLAVGTAVVSVASTVTAMLAFAIARHVARRSVARLASRRPIFAAVDAAIATGGWRVVGLLRLSPLVPFSLSNYLFGLTQIRFVPYALASFVGMLPGTFLYIYLGHVGSLGASGATPARWTMTGAGLLATLLMTIYVTRLARAALRAQTSATE